MLASPFVSRLVYDETTGEIALPPSPPLPSWTEKKGKPSLPPYRHTKGRRYQLPRPWSSLLIVVGVTLSTITLLSYLIPPS